MSRQTVIPLAAALAVLVSSPRSTQAQATDPTAAKMLFDEGNLLYKAGDFAAACAKLEASFTLNPLIGTRGRLAECLEKVNRLASAWTAWRDVSAMGTHAPEERNRRRAALAQARAAALEPRLATLTVMVPVDARRSGLVVVRDGAEVPSALWGVAVPTDQGTVVIEARAPDHQPHRVEIQVRNGAILTATIPALEPVPTGDSQPPPAEDASGKKALPEPGQGTQAISTTGPIARPADSGLEVAGGRGPGALELEGGRVEPAVTRAVGPSRPALVAFGVTARADIDVQAGASAPLVGVAVQLGPQLELGGGGVLGVVKGPYAGMRLALVEGQVASRLAVRPVLALTAPLYLAEEASFVALIGQAGLEVVVGTTAGPVSLRAEVGYERLFAAPAQYAAGLTILSIGAAWHFIR